MNHRRARIALGGYRLAGSALYPFLGPYLGWRAARGKEDRARRMERYGHASALRPAGPLVWFHAASVGETNAVAPLIEEVRRRGIAVLLTTGTVTSAGIAGKRLGHVAIHQYVPLDLKPAIGRFLDHWRPDLAIFVESEIWPTTILELAARETPQVLVNGRLSDRSFASWRRRADLADVLFGSLTHVVAQSELDGERFRELGARDVSLSGNIKTDVAEPACDEGTLHELERQIGERERWAAASTFDGEEAIAAGVHRALSRDRDLLTIIVPRHPERGERIAAMLADKGLAVARRSQGDRITGETDVFLGDTIGEMGLYLRLSPITFIGRSLAKGGGQNPIEAAMLGSAVLAGTDVTNFRDTYRLLGEAGGARIVDGEQALAEAVAELLSDPDGRRAMVAGAATALDHMRGALGRTIEFLEPYLQPLAARSAAEGRP